MIERLVLIEHEAGGSVMFWMTHDGRLEWISSHADGALRDFVNNMELPPVFEWYRISRDGRVSGAPSNPRRRIAPPMSEIWGLILMRQRQESRLRRVRRFGQILRGEEPGGG